MEEINWKNSKEQLWFMKQLVEARTKNYFGNMWKMEMILEQVKT